MSNIIPFESGAQLPAYLRNADSSLAKINDDVAVGVQYPSISIKGKVFALVRDGERKVLTKPDDEDEVLQSIQLNVLRANAKARTYFGDAYVEGEESRTRPTCYSNDGVTPSPHSLEVQSHKCQVCPRAVWGTRTNDKGESMEGTECSPVTKLAVSAPDWMEDKNKRFQLRVPPASRKNFAEAVKAAKSRGIPYTAMVFKVSFDKDAPSPKLVFKPVGLLSDEDFQLSSSLYDDDLVRAICGLDDVVDPNAPVIAAPKKETAVDTEELDAAIAARKAPPPQAPAAAPAAATVKPKVKPIAPPAPAPAPAAAAPKPAAPPAAPSGMDDLMSELGGLLDSTDD